MTKNIINLKLQKHTISTKKGKQNKHKEAKRPQSQNDHTKTHTARDHHKKKNRY